MPGTPKTITIEHFHDRREDKKCCKVVVGTGEEVVGSQQRLPELLSVRDWRGSQFASRAAKTRCDALRIFLPSYPVCITSFVSNIVRLLIITGNRTRYQIRSDSFHDARIVFSLDLINTYVTTRLRIHLLHTARMFLRPWQMATTLYRWSDSAPFSLSIPAPMISCYVLHIGSTLYLHTSEYDDLCRNYTSTDTTPRLRTYTYMYLPVRSALKGT